MHLVFIFWWPSCDNGVVVNAVLLGRNGNELNDGETLVEEYGRNRRDEDLTLLTLIHCLDRLFLQDF